MKGVLVEQNRTTSIMSHKEAIRQVVVINVFDSFLQGDDVSFHRNVLFDGIFSSASRSWVPIVDAEPLLFGSSDWVPRCQSGIPHWWESVSGLVPRERRDWHSSR